MNNKYIIDFEPKFLSENKNNGIEELIEKAIYLSFLQLNYDNLISLDIKNTPLTNKCDLVRNKLGKILKKTDLAADIVYLETQDILGNDVVGHSILVVILEDNIYLVDPTYSQFFLKENCHLSKYLINSERKLVLLAPDPGYYYLNNKEDIFVAERLLEKGYIKLNDHIAKTYFDSFYKTRRGNGGYMELTNTSGKINGNIYIKSILKANEKRKAL